MKKDLPKPGQKVDFNKKENSELYTRNKSKRNKSGNMNNLEQ